MSITAHCLVKNEERFVWYSVMSVIDHVDKVLLWDTGSTDGTFEILGEIKKLKSGKVDLHEVGEVDSVSFTKVRQEMLDATKTDWFIIVDGDEIWWEESIKLVSELIRKKGEDIESIINPFYNLAGDIYHYQLESSGKYKIDGREGHINIRAVKRTIPGIHFDKPHGQQGVFDEDGILIQNRPRNKRIFIDFPYMHFTNVQRSYNREKDLEVPKRGQKLKYNLGMPFPKDFYYPEVFFRKRPSIVVSPWEKRSNNYLIKSYLIWPFRLIKNELSKSRIGY